MTESLTIDMLPGIDNPDYERVPTPAELNLQSPLDPDAQEAITQFRREDIAITQGYDPRLRVVLRPCSLDDSLQPDGMPSYLRFVEQVRNLSEDPRIKKYLYIESGAYPAKPRTGNDDFRGLEQSDLIEAHRLVTAAANMKVPLRGEVMSRDHIARYGDRLTSLQVGARDVGSTLLRHTLSAYQIPTYCKNAESGSVKVALNAVNTITTPHEGVEVTLADGTAGRLSKSLGNPNTSLLYRGGDDVKTPEAYQARVIEISNIGVAYDLDVSHDVTKAHARGKKSVTGQVAAFENTRRLMYSGKLGALPVGLMLEVYLLEGADPSQQTPGMSWTDPCIGIDQATEIMLDLARDHAKLLERK